MFFPHGRGVWLLRSPKHLLAPLSTELLSAGGTLDTHVLLPKPFPGQIHQVTTIQSLAFASGGLATLSDALQVLQLDPVLGPDCDGSGLSDFYEIVTGLAPDANNNLVPDNCPGG